MIDRKILNLFLMDLIDILIFLLTKDRYPEDQQKKVSELHTDYLLDWKEKIKTDYLKDE